jgi:HAD superfamily hydrolase (TIGR01549 family)
MALSHLKYIGFDLDNTLIDRDSAFVASAEKLLKLHNIFSDANLQAVIKKDNSGIIPREELYHWIIDNYNLSVTVEQIFSFFAENMGSFMKPEAEIISFLEELSKKVGIFLITNGSSKNQRSKIKHSGLEKIFENRIFISGEIGSVKPQKEIFQYVLEALKIKPETTAYVGDNPDTDILGANSCGIFSIMVRRLYNENVEPTFPNLIINNVLEIKELL